MNKIVRDNDPVPERPETLREGLPLDLTVRLTIEVEASAEVQKRRMTLNELFGLARPSGRTMGDIVAGIRQQRDEWDDRLGR